MKGATATTSKPKQPAIDYGAALGEVQASASKQAVDRFARAEAVIRTRPTALSAAEPAGEGSTAPAAAPQALVGVVAGAFDVRALKVGQTYDIPLNVIEPNPYSPRHFYKSAQIDKTAMSMEHKGQKVAANGYVTPEGRIRVIEGGTRLRSARAIGALTLRIAIEDPPENELDLYNRAVEFHDERTNHTALDTAVLMRKLLDEKICVSQDDLTTKIKVNGSAPSKQQVSMYMRIARHIPERLLVQMADHEVTSTLRVAYAISAFFTTAEYESDKDKYQAMAEEVIQEVIARNPGVREVEAMVQARLAGPKQRTRGDNTNVTFGEAKGVIKMFETRGQLDFSIKGLPAGKLGQLRATIEAICAGRMELQQPG